MARVAKSGRLKKHNCCLTCSIICFVLLFVFVAAVYIGGTIMFKTYVSPHIGGLSLNEALSLAGDVISGKEVKPNYSESDLDSFYSGLSSALFLSDKSEDELEYALVSEEKRAELAASFSAAEEESASSGSSYDEDAAYAAFLLKNNTARYALLSDAVKAKVSQAEYSALAADTQAAAAVRKRFGLKLYRLSIEEILGDTDFSAEDFSMEDTLEKTLSSLDFNFDSLEEYDIENAAAAQNEKFTTFSVTGKQASAFIDDIVTYLLTNETSPIRSNLSDFIPEDVPLTNYVKISSVTIMNTPLATVGDSAAYNQKDTALGITISVKLRNLVKKALQSEKMKEQMDGVPEFAVRLIPSLVPQAFSAGLTVYPLAEETDGREVAVRINKASAKNVKNLSKLVNALFSKNKDEDATKTFFGEINDNVVSAFSSVNKTVKINFVPSKDASGNPLKDSKGNTYSEMRIMTWETFLSMIDDSGTISPHDIFTMLKCLYITNNRPSELSLDSSMASFKSDMAQKYGLSLSYLDDNNLFSEDALEGLIENINLNTVDFSKSDDEMRVHLSAEAIASFATSMLKKEESSAVAAAEDSGTDNLLDSLDPKVCGVEIKKVKEQGGVKIYSFELLISVSIADMMEEQFSGEGTTATLVKKILPKDRSYFGVLLYISESEDAGKLVHKVGSSIDNPGEGETSLYRARIKINDFTYDQTDTVFETLNRVMETMGSSSFDISSITSEVENTLNDALTSLSDNDFNLSLRLYEGTGSNDRGGITLPSLYELLAGFVNDASFSKSDAQAVLSQIYGADASLLSKSFADSQADVFLGEINDKYYIKKASALSVSNLFGDDAGSLASSITADSIYFKPNAAEAELWEGEKKSLYTDTRSVEDLRICLTGSEIAALVAGSNLIPSDLASSFGTIEVIGARFITEEGKTYLCFDIKLAPTLEGEGAVKYANIFPEAVKLSAKVLLYAASYSEAEPRFSVSLAINDESAAKVFLLLKALGGDSLSEKGISDNFAESIATTFNTLEGVLPIYYANGETAYTVTLGGKTENCIKIADVFSFLVKVTNMKDSNDEATDPTALASRLRGFGAQLVGDAAATSTTYSWVEGLKVFADTDDDYIYTNMQRAYFLKNAPSMEDIYSGFSDLFETIGSNFNLKDDESGLFRYDGDIVNLKVSDKALAVLVSANQSFAGAVSGAGVSAELKSLKIYKENAKDVIETAIKITFNGSGADAMMPTYFFIKAKTKADGLGGYTTTLTMNNIGSDETAELFSNILSLAAQGMDASTFNKTSIESTINTAISTALGSFPEGVGFGTFSASDVSTEYNKTIYGNTMTVAAGDGYLSFPTIYSYLIDMFYSSDKPTEKEMQSMLVSLHDTNVNSEVVLNAKSDTAYTATGFKGSNPLTDAVGIFSDKYLASAISSLFTSENVNGNLSLSNGLAQTIVLRGLTAEEEKGARNVWKSKFFADEEDFELGDNYLIATAVIPLSAYSSGSGISLLPDDLWFTVLADLSTPANSKGLLYNMSQKDMEIFEHILSSNNASFNIDDIAVQFAGLIKDKIDDFAEDTFGVPMQVHYRLAADDFIYYDDYNHTDPEDEINASERMIATTSGVGYVIMSLTDLS